MGASCWYSTASTGFISLGCATPLLKLSENVGNPTGEQGGTTISMPQGFRIWFLQNCAEYFLVHEAWKKRDINRPVRPLAVWCGRRLEVLPICPDAEASLAHACKQPTFRERDRDCPEARFVAISRQTFLANHTSNVHWREAISK